mgnify:CR=1 FL=1
MSLSQISLTVHPAPLITKAPAPNTPIRKGSGKTPGCVARETPQAQGQNNNHVPERIEFEAM